MSPTARSLAYLRAHGALAQVVERWVPQARRRVDLFGWIDLICVGLQNDVEIYSGVTGVQATTTTNMPHRMDKLRSPECAMRMGVWLGCGNRLELHGWSKKGARGKRKTWQLTVRTITLADLDSEE